MKTIVIWDTCGLTNLKFFVLDGDYENLDQTYINAVDDKLRQKELNDLMQFDEQTGEPKGIEFFDVFPKEVFTAHPNEGVEVITCGFLP